MEASVRVVPAEMSKIGAPPRTISRAIATSASVRSAAVPPKVSAPELSPSAASLVIANVPAVMVHGVSGVVVPVRVKTEVPIFAKLLKP